MFVLLDEELECAFLEAVRALKASLVVGNAFQAVAAENAILAALVESAFQLAAV